MANVIKTYRSDQHGENAYIQYIVQKPNILWIMDLFGNNSIILELDKNISRWKRYWCTFFLGSKWKRIIK